MNATTVEAAIFGSAQEQSLDRLPFSGKLPEDLCGTYYLNGPARFRAGSVNRRHWLDGDGLVRALRFEQGAVSFTSRYVATRKFTEESQAGTALYRCFGTAFQGDHLRSGLALESPANVSVFPFAGRLLAFGEQSLPYEMNAQNLATRGEFDFAGALSAIAPFSAHPKFDPRNGRLCNFGLTYFGGRAKLFVYEFTPQLKLAGRAQTMLPGGNVIHDFAMSGKYSCFYLAPYRMSVRAMVKDGKSLLDALTWEPDKPSEILIFDRESMTVAALLPLPRAGFCLHLINAHEAGDLLVLDLITTAKPFFDQYFAEPALFSQILPCAITRYSIDTRTWRMQEILTFPQPWHFDFPSMADGAAGSAYRNFWALAMATEPPSTGKFYDRVFRFDWSNRRIADVYQTPPGSYLAGEPRFIAGPHGDESGTLICQQFEMPARRSSYLIFNAFALANGPIARMTLPQFDPPGFHTSFQAAST